MKHLEDREMTYWQHMRFALGGAGIALWGFCALVLHAVVPMILDDEGSKVAEWLSDYLAKDS